MKSFEHLIITRFNLNLYARDKHDAPTRTERWLAHRFEVFERLLPAFGRGADQPEFQVALSFRRGDARGLPAAASAVTSPSVRSSGPYFTALGRPDA